MQHMLSVTQGSCAVKRVRSRPVYGPHSVSSFSGGRPQGSSIFCSRLYFTRPMDSFSATAR